MFYKDLEKRKRLVIDYIKKNPKTTYQDLRRDLHTKIDKVYSKGMAEAFKEAGINPPRTFKRNSKEENKKTITEYIKKHPGVGGHIIAKETKRNPSNFFNSIKEAYKLARVEYKHNKINNKLREDIKKKIIILVKDNPLLTIQEIESNLDINLINFFKNFNEIYKLAGIKGISWKNKNRIKKRRLVIKFIKNNPLATQREVNKICKTKVQEIFKEGIFEAYQKAEMNYPFERRKIHGTALNEIKRRAQEFEKEIAIKLSGYGKVNRLVKTKRGVADIILERNNKKIIIEIKDYQLKDISVSQINQLNKYLEDSNTDIGILICHKKPQKDKFIIGKNTIFILEEQELNKIPKII
jgi:signal recognition particle subunit SEC65